MATIRESKSMVDYPPRSSLSMTHDPAVKVEEQEGGPYEGGALAPGGMANLYSKEYFAIPMNYMAVGIYNGALKGLCPVIFYNYFGFQSYQISAGMQLQGLAWNFKTFIGLIGDSFPIFGYNRKYYIMGGWTLASLLMIIGAIGMPLCTPYKNRETGEIQNPDAPTFGLRYYWLFCAQAFCFIFADVSCDAMVVELAQREPLLKRGSTQTTGQMWRFLTRAGGLFFTAFFMNTPDFGGTFTFGISFNLFMGICGVIGLIPAITAYWLDDKHVSEKLRIQEERMADMTAYNGADVSMTSAKPMTFGQRLGQFWTIFQQRAIWQVCMFQFLFGLLGGLGAANATDVQVEWAKVEPLQSNLMTACGFVLFFVGLWVLKTYLLNYSWRIIILVAFGLMNIVDATGNFFTIFDIIRNPWFYFGPSVIRELGDGIQYMAGSLVSVEVCDPGFEGVTYGLLSTVHNLSIPLASLISNQIGAILKVTSAQVEADSSWARWTVAGQYFIMYGMVCVSFVTLFLLPKDKKATQQLKKFGGSNKPVAAAIGIFLIIMLMYAVTGIILSCFPTTYCLKIIGGDGC